MQKFLLKIPGGIFGPEVEASLLEVLDMPNKQDQYDRIQRFVSCRKMIEVLLIVIISEQHDLNFSYRVLLQRHVFTAVADAAFACTAVRNMVSHSKPRAVQFHVVGGDRQECGR